MFSDTLAWYYQVWPWIGAGAALVILILLFGTDVLRGSLEKARWKDPVWLAWLAAVSYMLHNIEEYGMDLTGSMQGFPRAMEQLLGFLPSGLFFACVNISLVWLAGPIAAAMSRRHRLMSIGLAGFMFINLFTHLASFLATGRYNPGLLTAGLIFLPLTLWISYVNFGKERLKFSALASTLVVGAIGHIVLFSSILVLYRIVGDSMVAVIQVLNAALLLGLWYLMEKMAGGKMTEARA